MGDTAIDYATKAWNPVVGCTPAGDSCMNCWARLAHDRRHLAKLAGRRLPEMYAKSFSEIQFFPDRLHEPLHWREPQRVAVCFQSDLFHDDVAEVWQDVIFAAMALAQRHRFLLLTKRPMSMLKYLADSKREGRVINAAFDMDAVRRATRDGFPQGSPMEAPAWPLPNVWAGVSVSTHAEIHERLPLLSKTLAAHRWVSCEPLLGVPVIFFPLDCYRVEFVVAGCESGPGRRPADREWFQLLRDQCRSAAVPFWLKQTALCGKVVRSPYLDGQRYKELPEALRV